LDSSVFIEGSKKTHPEFFNAVINPLVFEGFVNDIVCSETWYIFLGLMGGASPLTLKQRSVITTVVAESHDLFAFYQQYTVLPGSLTITEKALGLIEKYGLLPNDALILSTCIAYDIRLFASHDPDFETACLSEGITLITPLNYRQIFS
jgi:predicted nucleic acid-binding protein